MEEEEEQEQQQHPRFFYCNVRTCDGNLLCSAAPHTSEGYVDLWTWMHAAYGGVLFFPISPLFKWMDSTNLPFYLGLSAVIFLAVIWELIERNKRFPELWQHVDRCICYCCLKCRGESKNPPPHEFDACINSTSDVVVTCLTYSLSWNVWLLEDTLGTKYMWGLLIASPVFCVLMAIVQAAGCSHCPHSGERVLDCCGSSGNSDNSALNNTEGCHYVHVQVRL